MFQFKQFTINQDKTAMKVGTDGVLLGAWTPIPGNCFSVLDIGTGTGLIALMLAQRCDAGQIDAIEIDENAHEQAVENFEASAWRDRLFCFHAGLDEFIDDPEDLYDLIVSNPPFYSEDVSSGNAQRDMARQNFSMPFEQLIQAAALFLRDGGIFSVIIPFKEEAGFIELAAQLELFPIKITRVKGTQHAELKRSLLAFTNINPSPPVVNELVIETARHQYTEDYISLTKEFYLNI